ncbi:MAG: DNA (cytosine-5-)-methyltransferase [Bacteroidetes bacterium GWA2_30_7]|nr:MAG: DNA (cytosine-5-)-methyltransferase [Bacteroidetes bacterium GWA2_30_7]
MNDCKYNTIDLFAGCGGLSEGFEKCNFFHSLAFVEWEKQPCLTLTKRLKKKWNYKNSDEIVLQFDMQRTEELIYGWESDNIYGNNTGLKTIVGDKVVDLIIGGPPCQAYSIAGRVRDENGMQDDYRNFLFESYLKIVKQFNPKVFVFENVEGILSANPDGISIIERIADDFNKIGYKIIDNLRKYALLNAADYGVPQNRKRVIIIGVDINQIQTSPDFALVDFYSNILPSFIDKKQKTVKDALLDLPKIYPFNSIKRVNGKKLSHNVNGSNVLNHFPRFHSERDIEIFEELAIDKKEKSNKYPNSQALIELYYQKTGKQSNFHKYHVLELEKPSNTIPAHLYKDGLRHIHPDPDQARSITPREAARLQGFDDDFEFLGSMGDQFKMIGNAVPPPLAESVAHAINIFIKKYF